YAESQDITYEGDRADYTISIRTEASSTAAYNFIITDSLPCLDYTPDAMAQYDSPDANTVGFCQNPAFQPDECIELRLYPAYSSINDPDDFATANPTIPLNYVDTDGNEGVINVPYNSVGGFGTNENILYKITWLDVLGDISPGAGISTLIWSSVDIGVAAIVTPDDNRNIATMTLVGNVAEDSPTYPMLNQYRVRNEADFEIVVGTDTIYAGEIQDDLIINDEGMIFRPQKNNQ
ncbi:MAG: hypothetical protein AAFO82_15840, partial [Bacteroidota bacterium]